MRVSKYLAYNSGLRRPGVCSEMFTGSLVYRALWVIGPWVPEEPVV